jgi:hypothetical protein
VAGHQRHSTRCGMRRELTSAIESALAVVVCLSDHWAASMECRAEFDRAVEVGKRLIPVVVGPVGATALPPELAALQRIEAGELAPDIVADRVLAAIDVDPMRVRAHTLWLGRALRWEAAGKESSLLLRGRELRSAEEWLSSPGGPPRPTALHARFVAASRRRDRLRLRACWSRPSSPSFCRPLWVWPHWCNAHGRYTSEMTRSRGSSRRRR